MAARVDLSAVGVDFGCSVGLIVDACRLAAPDAGWQNSLRRELPLHSPQVLFFIDFQGIFWSFSAYLPQKEKKKVARTNPGARGAPNVFFCFSTPRRGYVRTIATTITSTVL